MSCRHLEQMKRRLQKALQSTSHTVCSSTGIGNGASSCLRFLFSIIIYIYIYIYIYILKAKLLLS